MHYFAVSIRETIKNRPSLVAILLIVFSAVAVSYNASAILLSLIFLYQILRKTIGIKLQSSRVNVSIITVISYLFLLQSVSIAPWIIDHNFSNKIAVVATLGLIIIWLFFLRKQPKQGDIPLFQLDNLLSILVSLIVISIIFIGPLYHGKALSWTAVSAVSGNVDDAAHLSYFDNRLQLSDGLILGYPAGWHTVGALVTNAFYPSIKIGYESLLAYVVIKTLSFGLLIYSTTEVAFYLYHASQKKARRNAAALLGISLGVGLLSYLFFINVYALGYFSFLPQLIGIIWVVGFLAQAALSEGPSQLSDSLLMAVLFSVGGCLSWILLAPPLFLAIAFIGFLKIPSDHWKEYARILSVRALPVMVLLGISLLTQVIVLSSGPTALSFLQSIVINGAITTYSAAFYFIIAAGVTAYFYLCHNRNLLFSILYILLPLLAFSLFIWIVQLIEDNQNSYYYYKVVYADVIAAIPALLAAFGLLMDIAFKKIGWHSLSASILLLLFILLFTPGSSTNFAYIKGHRWLKPTDSTAVRYFLNVPAKQASNEQVFYYSPSNGVRADIMMLLAVTPSQNAGCFNQVRTVIRYQQDNAGTLNPIVSAIASDCKVSVTLFTDPPLVPQANSLVAHSGATSPIRIESF